MGAGSSHEPDSDTWACADVLTLADDERDRALRLIGKPGLLTARAKLSSLSEWQRWREDLTATLGGADSIAGASHSLAELQAQWAEDEGIAATLYRTLLQAHMGGQLFVRDVEVPDAGRTALSRRVALDDGGAAFFSLEFREALEAFLRREVVSPDEWADLSDSMRLRAFSATRLASEQVIQRARDLVERHLADGGTVRGFILALQAEEVSLGIEPSTPHYIENVARTNTQMAYGQGRLQQLDHPDVIRARPYVEYRTAQDTRVRPSHAALDGVVFDRANDPGWRRYAPPLGYQCRCSVVTVRRPGSVTASHELSHDVGPEPGWSGPGSDTGP